MFLTLSFWLSAFADVGPLRYGLSDGKQAMTRPMLQPRLLHRPRVATDIVKQFVPRQAIGFTGCEKENSTYQLY